MSNAPSKPVSFSRPKVGYFSNRPRIGLYKLNLLCDGLNLEIRDLSDLVVYKKTLHIKDDIKLI